MIDAITVDTECRFKALNQYFEQFGFIYDSSYLNSISKEDILKYCNDLVVSPEDSDVFIGVYKTSALPSHQDPISKRLTHPRKRDKLKALSHMHIWSNRLGQFFTQLRVKGCRRKPVSEEAIEKVALQVEEEKASNVQASTNVRLVAEALDLPRSTVQKIMRNILRYYPYKLQLVQELLPHNFETRHLFLLQFLASLEVDPEWPWNILWTDEAHFHLDGSANTHNCQI
ncbi:uncharacterized protein TNCV_413731 [Trichonephila clavipes]|nr:uncharacterized protein TNCV_413731 [Trichonephila clavipes]